jgi:hypothetical protein
MPLRTSPRVGSVSIISHTNKPINAAANHIAKPVFDLSQMLFIVRQKMNANKSDWPQ